MKLKRSERLIDMTQRLLDNPHTLISLTTFTALYQSAKSSISEDIAIIQSWNRKQNHARSRQAPKCRMEKFFKHLDSFRCVS